jgi:glyoxylase-like metal-dependent hydrolase (beta-lactamase superfamily II)
MKQLTIGDVTITSIVERDGPWRKPEDMFPAYDPAVGKGHLAEMDAEVFDAASGKMVITYQTYVVRTHRHTILIDTCTGEDKGYAAPMDFPKQPWLDGFRAAGLRFEDIDYVFCTHLHIDHCGWNTVLRDGRWVPTFPKAKYIFHKREYAAWEEATKRGATPPGNVWRYNCEPVVAAGQALLVDDDFELDDTFRLTPTPGHSPCHCCVNIRSRGRRRSSSAT